MKRSVVLGALVGLVVVLIVSVWLVNAQFSNFQTQIAELQSQNSELENQNSALQNQTIALQNQTQQLQDRIKQLLEQIDESYNSPVQIISYKWLDGFNPYISVYLIYPVNVTIQNNGDADARELSLVVKLINMYNGSQIGVSGSKNIEKLSPGEKMEIETGAYASLDASLADAACVITLKLGGTVIDQWTRSIN